MQRNISSNKILVSAMSISLAITLTGTASAQQIKPLEIEPDENGVDMLSGEIKPSLPTLSIPAAPSLTLDRVADFMPYLDGQVIGFGDRASFQVNTGTYTSEGFSCIDNDCRGSSGRGSIMVISPLNGNGFFGYFEGQTGREIYFDRQSYWSVTGGGGAGPQTARMGYYASSIVHKNGERISLIYNTAPTGVPNATYYRISRAVSNLGYQLNFTYASNDTNQFVDWNRVTQATIYKSSDLNTPLARHSYSQTSANHYQITDLIGRTWNCTNCHVGINAPALTSSGSMRMPGEASNSYEATATSVTDNNGNHSVVGQVVKNGVTTNYSYVADNSPPPPGTPIGQLRIKKVTVTAPNGFTRIIDNDNSTRPKVIKTTDPNGRQTRYEYDGAHRLNKVISPEGGAVEITYTIGGNITEKRTKAKPGSGIADIIETADYNYTDLCDQMSCFRPNYTIDGRGNRTDYTWDSRGQLLTKTDPVDVNGVRPKTINEYELHPAVGGSISRLKKTRLCGVNNGSNAVCDTSDISITEYTYWESTFLPLSVVVTDPATGEKLRTCYRYNARGEKISETQPKANLASCPAS